MSKTQFIETRECLSQSIALTYCLSMLMACSFLVLGSCKKTSSPVFGWRSLKSCMRSPRMRLARSMSFFITVILLAWMAHKLVSSKRPTM